MARMTDCSFAHAAMVVPRRGSCVFPAVFPSSRLAPLGLSYFSHWRTGAFQGGIGVEGWCGASFLGRRLELVF